MPKRRCETYELVVSSLLLRNVLKLFVNIFSTSKQREQNREIKSGTIQASLQQKGMPTVIFTAELWSS